MSSDDEISVFDEVSYNHSEDDDASSDAEAEAVGNLIVTEDDCKNSILYAAIALWRSAETVQLALQNGANVNFHSLHHDSTPLCVACQYGLDEIVGILLDAGADARWRNCVGSSAIINACDNGHLSTVQLLIHHDIGLLEIVDDSGWTPLFHALEEQNSDIVRFLLDSGADPHHVDHDGVTALMTPCQLDDLDSARRLLAASMDVEARDKWQQTALHYAAYGASREIMLELMLRHNATMFVVDINGLSPFDMACNSVEGDVAVDPLLEVYANKLTQDHVRLALHELLKVAKYSFAEDEEFHPPLNPLRIILPLGKLKLKYLRTLLHRLDAELIHNRDDTGKLPIHIACQTGAPVEVLAVLLELDPATLHMADYAGSLPVHLLLCGNDTTEYASVRYVVEQSGGGVGTLAARNHQGALPLHVLCARSSANPSSLMRTVQYLIQSFPGAVAMRTNAGEYPFMVAAAANDSSSASLSVVYELVRANPGLVVSGYFS